MTNPTETNEPEKEEEVTDHYEGRCSRCNQVHSYPTRGDKACRWGGCNGTVQATRKVQ